MIGSVNIRPIQCLVTNVHVKSQSGGYNHRWPAVSLKLIGVELQCLSDWPIDFIILIDDGQITHFTLNTHTGWKRFEMVFNIV